MRNLFYLFLAFITVASCQPKPDTAGRSPEDPAANKNITEVQKIPIPSAWTLVSCERDGKTIPAVNDRCFIALRDGQIGGNTGCNGFGGDWSGSPTKMKVPGVMATKMYCEDAAEQEAMILDMLNGTIKLEMVNPKTLLITSGKQQLKLARNDGKLKQ